MKKTLLVVALSGLLLSACGSHRDHERHVNAGRDPLNTRVSILDGKQIVVDQEPIFFAKGMKDVRVTWHLATDSKYTFGKDGIVVAEAREEIVDCRAAQDGKSFSCLNRHTKPGKYKYTVKLEGVPAVAPLDPVMVND
jgi:hypothetical protein